MEEKNGLILIFLSDVYSSYMQKFIQNTNGAKKKMRLLKKKVIYETFQQ